VRAIPTLELPGCDGSWFSVKFQHLRYTDWDVALPVYLYIKSRTEHALFLRYLTSHRRRANPGSWRTLPAYWILAGTSQASAPK